MTFEISNSNCISYQSISEIREFEYPTTNSNSTNTTPAYLTIHGSFVCRSLIWPLSAMVWQRLIHTSAPSLTRTSQECIMSMQHWRTRSTDVHAYCIHQMSHVVVGKNHQIFLFWGQHVILTAVKDRSGLSQAL